MTEQIQPYLSAKVFSHLPQSPSLCTCICNVNRSCRAYLYRGYLQILNANPVDDMYVKGVRIEDQLLSIEDGVLVPRPELLLALRSLSREVLKRGTGLGTRTQDEGTKNARNY